MVYFSPSSTQQVVALFDRWQTLVGSALGPFFAVLLSAIGFYLKEKYTIRKKVKEGRMRVESSVTRTLNEILQTQSQLRYTSELIRVLVKMIRAVTDPNEISLNTVNFPVTGDVYRDVELPLVKTRSYYIHNKLIFLDRAVRDMNKLLEALKEDFKDLIVLNRLVADKMGKPEDQRRTYAQNLEAFAVMMDRYCEEEFPHILHLAVEIKLYNQRLSKRPILTRIKYERLKHLIFPGAAKKAIQDLTAIERIDGMLKDEVEKAIETVDRKNRERNPIKL